METSQQNTRLVIGLAIAVVLIVVAGWGGYALGLSASSPAQTAGPQRIAKTLVGTITAIDGTTLTLQPVAYDMKVASTSRQVLTDDATRFVRMVAKSPERYQSELNALLKQKEAAPPATATSSPFSGYPSPFIQENISFSDLRVGDTITVSAADNILTASQFKAVQVALQLSQENNIKTSP